MCFAWPFTACCPPPADHTTHFPMLSVPLSRPLATALDVSRTARSLDASTIARRYRIQCPADEISSPLATSHDIIRKCVQLFGGAFKLFSDLFEWYRNIFTPGNTHTLELSFLRRLCPKPAGGTSNDSGGLERAGRNISKGTLLLFLFLGAAINITSLGIRPWRCVPREQVCYNIFGNIFLGATGT